eukprot:3058390-Rhodomonas_salina.1
MRIRGRAAAAASLWQERATARSTCRDRETGERIGGRKSGRSTEGEAQSVGAGSWDERDRQNVHRARRQSPSIDAFSNADCEKERLTHRPGRPCAWWQIPKRDRWCHSTGSRTAKNSARTTSAQRARRCAGLAERMARGAVIG